MNEHDFKKLISKTDPKYIKVPSQTRQQSFVMYRLDHDIDQNFQNFQTAFDDHYLTVMQNENGKDPSMIILIPFKDEIKSKDLDQLSIPGIDHNFKRLMYGDYYRDRSKNPIPFENYNESVGEFDAGKDIDNDPAFFDSQKVIAGLKLYLKSNHFKQIQNQPLKLRKFLYPLAKDVYDKIYPKRDLDAMLKIMGTQINTIDQEYQAAANDIQNNPALRNKTRPFGAVLKLYQFDDKANTNIAQQMLASMNADFEPNPKLQLAIASDLIIQNYPPALMNQDGSDKDNVVIFNPLTGEWIHDEDLFYSLLTALRPYSKPTDLSTMIATFAAKARNNNSFIDPYYKSRYLLFLNCALDVKEMKTYALNSDLVKNLYFTERNQLNINYAPEVTAAPEFPGRLAHQNGTWDPLTFFMAYANNDVEKLQFLMFGLSLGLFGGHNFGIHFDIRGESRWGKTTLNEIFKALYPGRVLEDNFSAFNEQFGFTNYKTKNSIIWLGECNDDSAPLNNEYGIQAYDALANNQASVRVKGKNNIIINHPPQVYIDGTSYVRAKNMDTGPAGRTLVYHLPMDDDPDTDIEGLIKQSYGVGIEELLHNPQVLQYLVNMMIKAYRTCLHLDPESNRLWSLTLNLGGKNSDIKLFPVFAQQWRKEMVRTQGGDIQEWFEFDFEPYFSQDPQNPTQMHNTLAYVFYAKNYEIKYSHVDPNKRYLLSELNFSRQFKSLLSQYNWQMVESRETSGRKMRKANRSLSSLNFNLNGFVNDGHTVPYEFTDKNINNDSNLKQNPYPLGQKTSGWYKIKKIKE